MSSIRIKRRITGELGPPEGLVGGELAYNEIDDTLYYGSGVAADGRTATVILPIGGEGFFPGYGHALTDDLAGDPGPDGGGSSGGYTNILDYGGGVGGDDALAMRSAIAAGKQVILVPPGTYTMKSTIPSWGHAANPCCFEINNRENVWIIAHGATFTVHNSISGPTPVTMLNIVNNSKHCGMLGGTFVGNKTGLAAGAENVAVNMASVTGCVVRDLKVTGSTTAAFSGVFIFDTLIENVQAFGVALGLDIAHTENLTVRDCRFVADPALPVSGINQHYDTPTLADNAVTREDGTARTLTWNQANRLNVLDTTFEGFNNSVSVEGMRGLFVRGCTLRGSIAPYGLRATVRSAEPLTLYGTAGVQVYLSTAAQSAGLLTQDIHVDGCSISGHGVDTSLLGGGVLINQNVSRVFVENSRIYDNTGYGINASTLTGVANINEALNSYASRSGGTAQAAPLHPNLVTVVTTSLGANATTPTLTVRADAILATGPIASQAVLPNALAFENNAAVSWKDAAGTYQPIIGVSPSNITFLRPASDAATLVIQSKSGADWLKASAGAVEAMVPVALQNNSALYFRDAATAFQPVLGVSNLNITYLRMGSNAAWISLQSQSGTELVQISTAGTKLTNGLGVWGVTPPAAKPARPVTLADVIAVLVQYGLTA